MRKIAAAAAAIPWIIYLYLSALIRRIWPSRPKDVQPGRELRAHTAKDARAQSSKVSTSESVRASSAIYMATPPPDAPIVPVVPARLPSAAPTAPIPPAAPIVQASPVKPGIPSSAGSIRGLGSGSIRSQARPSVSASEYRPTYVAPAVSAHVPDDSPPPGEAGQRRLFGGGLVQIAAMAVAIALLVSGLLLGLPAKQVSGVTPANFAPIAPQQGSGRAQSDLPLDVGFQLKFTKPMNQASVESALTITPQVGVKLQWDATGETVALVPSPHWDPKTTYVVAVGDTATDQQGLGLSNVIETQFTSGDLTSGTMIATEMVGDLASPGTAFQITFTRPVKLIMVQAHLTVNGVALCPPVAGVVSPPVGGVCAPVNGVSPTPVCPSVDTPAPTPVNGVCPNIPLDIVGDDPSDVASQVFTATPHTQLASKSSYTINFSVGSGSTAATDAAGALLQPVAPLAVTTLAAPAVVRFRPQDGSVSYDTNQNISVRFSTAMEPRSTAAAFSVTVNGVAVAGTKSWAEGNTVLIFNARKSFTVGTSVVAKVTSAGRAVGGLHLGTTYTATFKISKKPAASIGYGGAPTKSSPWYASEVYYLRLMNCTRTGGWVTSNGSCSSVTHHTLPSQNALRLSSGISNTVSRPYAKYMADNRLLSHYLRGSNPHSRMCKAGYCGGGWGENIASPSSTGKGGMISIEIFYQNEYWCRCEHYYNIMNPHFGVAGVGVWFSKSVRVAIDFYS